MGEPATSASSSPGATGETATAAPTVASSSSSSSSSAVQQSPSPSQSSPGVATARVSSKPQVVRIEVLGDDKVGKTSLICSLVSRHFSERVPAVLLNVQIPAEENNENVIISITDTSSRVSDLVRVANATKRSDAILLVYDLTRPETIQRLRRWLDLIARHKEVPVVLVGNKDDIKTVVTSSTIMDGLHSNQIRQLTTTYQFAVDGGDCSARNFAQVARAFYYAQKAVLYPVEPLYNGKKRVLEPKCIKAIKRTFRLFDRDRDGLLSRDELNDYQHDCFGMRLLPAEMDTMIEFLQSTIPEGVKEDGTAVRFHGFLYLWQLFIDRKRPESCWLVLRGLGYNNEIQLEIPPERIALVPHESDQSAQLTKEAVDFLDALLRQFDGDKDGNLTEDELDEIFSICEDEEPPWRTCSAIATPIWFATTLVADRLVLSRAAWLALWSFVAQENPEKLLETLFYLGYNDKIHPALEFTKSRSTTRQASLIERNVVTCYLYASARSLKKRFANALVGRKTVSSITTSNESSTSVGTKSENELADELDVDEMIRAVNAVVAKDATTYLLLTEQLSENEVDKRADVLCFLYDPLDPASLDFVRAVDAKLSSAIPRVFIGVKPENVVRTSTEWDAVRLTKTSSTHLMEDDKSTAEAFERLVRTATRPPNTRSRGSRFAMGTTTTLLTLVIVGGVVALSFGKNRERVKEAAIVVREASLKFFRA